MTKSLKQMESLTLMSDLQMGILISRLAQLAANAAEHAERDDNTPPGYWQGVSFGLHKALAETQSFAQPEAELPDIAVHVMTEPNDVQDGIEPLLDESTPFYASDEADGDADDD